MYVFGFIDVLIRFSGQKFKRPGNTQKTVGMQYLNKYWSYFHQNRSHMYLG